MLNVEKSFLLIILIFTILFIFSKFYVNFFDKKATGKKNFLKKYMGIIYIVFGILKLYDLNKFAEIFSKYDIIGNKFNTYAYLYPFIEIFLGIFLLKDILVKETLTFTIFLMIISIISVVISLINGQKLRCGCMGSFFHIPLSYVTLSENLVMLLMGINHLYPLHFKKLLTIDSN